MAKMVANRLMGTLKGKSRAKQNGPGKHKERGNKLNGPTWQEWQPVGPWAH